MCVGNLKNLHDGPLCCVCVCAKCECVLFVASRLVLKSRCFCCKISTSHVRCIHHEAGSGDDGGLTPGSEMWQNRRTAPRAEGCTDQGCSASRVIVACRDRLTDRLTVCAGEGGLGEGGVANLPDNIATCGTRLLRAVLFCTLVVASTCFCVRLCSPVVALTVTQEAGPLVQLFNAACAEIVQFV